MRPNFDEVVVVAVEHDPRLVVLGGALEGDLRRRRPGTRGRGAQRRGSWRRSVCRRCRPAWAGMCSAPPPTVSAWSRRTTSHGGPDVGAVELVDDGCHRRRRRPSRPGRTGSSRSRPSAARRRSDSAAGPICGLANVLSGAGRPTGGNVVAVERVGRRQVRAVRVDPHVVGQRRVGREPPSCRPPSLRGLPVVLVDELERRGCRRPRSCAPTPSCRRRVTRAGRPAGSSG